MKNFTCNFTVSVSIFLSHDFSVFFLFSCIIITRRQNKEENVFVELNMHLASTLMVNGRYGNIYAKALRPRRRYTLHTMIFIRCDSSLTFQLTGSCAVLVSQSMTFSLFARHSTRKTIFGFLLHLSRQNDRHCIGSVMWMSSCGCGNTQLPQVTIR